MNKLPEADFTQFIEFFPKLELPFSLLPDISQIPSSSTPLPQTLIEEFILPLEGSEADEYTEYIPFGSIEEVKDFYAVIYWKAGILQYEFVLATYNKNGAPISHAIIGGIRMDEEGLLHSVAVIHEDLTITIAEGMADEEESEDLSQTNTYQMMIGSSGLISYDMNEEVKEE